MFAAYLLLITVVFTLGLSIYHSWPKHSYIQVWTATYYDYVIVGGGTAGCALARRLAEDLQLTVLLLEAGDEETRSEIINMPLTAKEVQKTQVDWSFMTTPQAACCQGFINKQQLLPAGKILGGTSSINYLIYNRGHRSDYEAWNEDSPGWTFEDVLPYFVKAEKSHVAAYKDSPFHGDNGPQIISDMTTTPLADYFLRAGHELGYKQIDINANHEMGVSRLTGMTNTGRRWSSFKAYLEPALPWKNLHVVTLAHVNKVLFAGNQAVGVEFKRNGTTHQVKARREVILTAGVYASPHILMLSGVGPKQHLDSFNIPVVADLPVGDNLQDHISTDALTYFTRDSISITDSRAKSLFSLFEYLVFGKGPLSTVAIEGQALLGALDSQNNVTQPAYMVQLYSSLLGTGMTRDSVAQTRLRLNMEYKVFEALHGKMGDVSGLMLMPVVLHPYSRGSVRLASTEPSAKPLVDPNFLNDTRDADSLLEAIRMAQKFASTKNFAAVLGLSAAKREHPYCKSEEFEYDSDEYWKCYMRYNTLPMFNSVGTCQMSGVVGKGVVDTQFRVKNVRRLRVVDASVIPRLLSGGSHAPVVMLAERAADFIVGRKPLPPIDTTKKRHTIKPVVDHVHSEL